MSWCDHEFIEFTYPKIKNKKRLVCAYCGHIREVCDDGTVIIITKSHEQPDINTNTTKTGKFK